jgi:hypothetical protein
MSTYTGLHYGLFLDAEKLTSDDDVEKYFDGDKTSVLKKIENETKFDTNSLDEMMGIFIAKPVHGYNCHYSGCTEKVNITPIIDFNNNLATIEKELNADIVKMNAILVEHGFSPIDENSKFYYFEHTVT